MNGATQRRSYNALMKTCLSRFFIFMTAPESLVTWQLRDSYAHRVWLQPYSATPGVMPRLHYRARIHTHTPVTSGSTGSAASHQDTPQQWMSQQVQRTSAAAITLSHAARVRRRILTKNSTDNVGQLEALCRSPQIDCDCRVTPSNSVTSKSIILSSVSLGMTQHRVVTVYNSHARFISSVNKGFVQAVFLDTS